MLRYDANGQLDTGFGTGGIAVQSSGGFDGHATAVAIDSTGRILASGPTSVANGDGAFAVIRFNANGTTDGSFGNSGVAVTDLGLTVDAHGIAIQSDGKIVVAGTADDDFAVARYNGDTIAPPPPPASLQPDPLHSGRHAAGLGDDQNVPGDFAQVMHAPRFDVEFELRLRERQHLVIRWIEVDLKLIYRQPQLPW